MVPIFLRLRNVLLMLTIMWMIVGLAVSSPCLAGSFTGTLSIPLTDVPPIEEANLPDSPLRLLYNSANGDVFVHRPDATDNTDYSSILLGSRLENLRFDSVLTPPGTSKQIVLEWQLPDSTEVNLFEVYAPNQPFSSLSGGMYAILLWSTQRSLSDISPTNPIYLGAAFEPDTIVDEIFVGFTVRGYEGMVFPEIVQIPETTTFVLLITSIAQAVLCRYQRSATGQQ